MLQSGINVDFTENVTAGQNVSNEAYPACLLSARISQKSAIREERKGRFQNCVKFGSVIKIMSRNVG